MYTRKIAIMHLRSHLRARMALDHSRLGLENWFLENRPHFLHLTSLLYKILPTNLGACQNQPLILFIHHVQNVVFHSFLRQIALIQYSGPLKHAWAFSESLLINFQNHLYCQPVLTFWQVPNLRWTLIQLRFNFIKSLLCLFFI